MLIDLSEAVEFLKGCEDAVILTHQSPDGDCIGAGFALKDLLEALGKRSRVLCSDEFPKRYDFMTSVGSGEEFEPKTVIAVDIADPQLMGNLRETYENKVQLCIDHHISNVGYAEKTLLNAGASATCELIYELADAMKIQMSDHCAACIYTGMMTDTGGFTYNSNNREIYFIISELLSKGIDKDEIYRRVFNTYSESRLRLMGYVLSQMKVYPNYHAALISLTKAEQSQFDYVRGDSEGFVNIPLSIKGVIFSCFLREDTEKPMIKISLRSVGTFPCNQLAAEFFGGGGHLNASGGEFYGTMDEARKVFEQALEKYKPLLNAKG